MSWIKRKLSEAKVVRAVENARDEALYARVAAELARAEVRPGLWAKATNLAEGNERKATAQYIGLRVEQLKIQLGAATALVNHTTVPESVPVAKAQQISEVLVAKPGIAAWTNGLVTDRQPLKSEMGNCPSCGRQALLTCIHCPWCALKHGSSEIYKLKSP